MRSSKPAVLLGNEGLVNSPYFSENNDMMASLLTDNEVGKYSFYSCLSHYMEGHKISVELCILSEAGAFVRNMDLMKTDKKEKVFFVKYVSIIDEIEDKEFEDALVHNNMRQRYRLVWAEPKTIATSAVLYLIKLVSYHFTLKLPCFCDTKRKPLKRAF
jgi:hypothetical protein